MKLGVHTPGTLIDIRTLPLSTIEARPDGSVLLGALATNTDVANHPFLNQHFPIVPWTLLSGATPQVRDAATVGGNILQRTRCWYFRERTIACNKKEPGTGCPARAGGFSGEHAILGTSPQCIAVHPSDLAVALLTLDAVLHLASIHGTRTVPFAEFHLLPGTTPERETVLAPGELITAVELPATPFAGLSHYVKTPVDGFAQASAGVALELRSGRVQDVRVAFGGVAHKPWRAYGVEAALRGQLLDAATLAAVAAAAVAGAETTPMNAHKVPLLQVVLQRALTTLQARA